MKEGKEEEEEAAERETSIVHNMDGNYVRCGSLHFEWLVWWKHVTLLWDLTTCIL